MKSIRILAKSHKNTGVCEPCKDTFVRGVKRKTVAKNRSSKKTTKISANTQFSRIKQALKEVDMIEAGIIKPTSLDELLDEL